jgi:hypothetical protein
VKALEAANFPSGDRSIAIFLDMLAKHDLELVHKAKFHEIEDMVIRQHQINRDLREARDEQAPALQDYAEIIKTLRYKIAELQDRMRNAGLEP